MTAGEEGSMSEGSMSERLGLDAAELRRLADVDGAFVVRHELREMADMIARRGDNTRVKWYLNLHFAGREMVEAALAKKRAKEAERG